MDARQRTSEKDRRAYVRYEHNFDIAYRPLNRADDAGWSATVADLSQGGLGLETECACALGAVLAVTFEGLGGRFARPVLVRVTHVQRVSPSVWQLGCSFVTRLSDDDLQLLLTYARS